MKDAVRAAAQYGLLWTVEFLGGPERGVYTVVQNYTDIDISFFGGGG